MVFICFCESWIVTYISFWSSNWFSKYVLMSACWGLTSNVVFVLYVFAVFFIRVLVSFPGNGFNVHSYIQFIVHVTCFIGSWLNLCISCLSLFLLCSWIVFVDLVAFAFWSFVLFEFWSFGVFFRILRHACDDALFLFSVFSLKLVFLSKSRVFVSFDVPGNVLNTSHCLISIFRLF